MLLRIRIILKIPLIFQNKTMYAVNVVTVLFSMMILRSQSLPFNETLNWLEKFTNSTILYPKIDRGRGPAAVLVANHGRAADVRGRARLQPRASRGRGPHPRLLRPGRRGDSRAVPPVRGRRGVSAARHPQRRELRAAVLLHLPRLPDHLLQHVDGVEAGVSSGRRDHLPSCL